MKAKDLFQNKKMMMVCAVLCTLLWGSAFPCIKTGYQMFHIEAADFGSQMVFAGVRFLCAGLVTIVVSFFAERNQYRKSAFTRKMVGGVLLLGFVQTCLQYVFYYIGMAHVTGVKGAIMNGTSAFLCVISACLFYRKEKMTRMKFLGCVLGLAGVVIVNLGKGELGGSFSFLGEGFMLISAVVVALGAFISKEVSQKMGPVTLCGWQLLAGGVLLLVAGAMSGGRLDWKSAGMTGIVLMAYMVFISAAAFALWTILLKYNAMSRVTVFNFLIPVFGTILSVIVLQENAINIATMISLPLVCVGVYLVNR